MELEWKFAADQQSIAKIKSEAAEWHTIEMESTYYDTPARTLSALRWTLRQRQENSKLVICLKTPTAGRARGEWEVRCGSPAETVPSLLSLGAPAELEALIAGQPLEPVCGAQFTRLAATLPLQDTTVELALDSGVLTAGARMLPLCEVEVELKAGDPAAAERYARKLAETYGLQEETRSKFQRAFHLAQHGQATDQSS